MTLNNKMSPDLIKQFCPRNPHSLTLLPLKLVSYSLHLDISFLALTGPQGVKMSLKKALES